LADRRGGEALPFAGFLDELLAPEGGEGARARPPVVRGDAPLAGNPAPLFQALERGKESAVLDEQLMIRGVLDGMADRLAVPRAEDRRAEDQQVQRALQQVERLALSGRHLT